MHPFRNPGSGSGIARLIGALLFKRLMLFIEQVKNYLAHT
jgi:hypothetical protein